MNASQREHFLKIAGVHSNLLQLLMNNLFLHREGANLICQISQFLMAKLSAYPLPNAGRIKSLSGTFGRV